jgi:hypothetical protein
LFTSGVAEVEVDPVAQLFLGLIALLFLITVLGPQIEERLNKRKSR